MIPAVPDWLARLLSWAGVLLLTASAAFFIWQGVEALPDRYKPWTPLDLAAEEGPFTEQKLAALQGDFDACLAVLETGTLEVGEVEARRTDRGCGWDRAVHIEQATALYSAPQPVVTRCPLAAALHLWETRVLAPAAERHFGEGVAEILHYGVYNCRSVNNRAGARLSEHAFGNAIDIAGVRLDSGRIVRVVSGWDGPEDEQAFLRDLRDGGCRYFRGINSPDANAAHADHFHFDMGPFSYCR